MVELIYIKMSKFSNKIATKLNVQVIPKIGLDGISIQHFIIKRNPLFLSIYQILTLNFGFKVLSSKFELTSQSFILVGPDAEG